MSQNKIAEIYKILSHNYTTFDKTDDPWMTEGLSSTPFKSLVSVALSTMTTTKRVVAACQPLYKKVSTFEELLALDDDELRAMIKPVAHYNRKTKNLKKMCREIIEEHGGVIPNTLEGLLSLTGIGRKCAEITMNFVFNEPLIAVDTHVHRLTNRLGTVKTKSAEETSDRLNEITPKKYKQHAHEWLIQHGAKICVARTPKCGECVLTGLCDFYSSTVISPPRRSNVKRIDKTRQSETAN